MNGSDHKLLLYAALAAVLLAAVLTDLRSRRIPNVITLPAAILALAAHALAPGAAGPAGGLLWGLGGLAVGLGLMLPAYLAGVMGGGDVKLMGAVGAFLGPWGGFTAVLFTCLAGGLLSLAHLAAGWMDSRDGGPRSAMRAAMGFLATGELANLTSGAAGTPESRAKVLPYGLAIAAGSLGAMAWDLAGHPFLRIF
jgi:prepilin peptidase CpaA